jgi:hypothetical protein
MIKDGIDENRIREIDEYFETKEQYCTRIPTIDTELEKYVKLYKKCGRNKDVVQIRMAEVFLFVPQSDKTLLRVF